MKYKIGYKIKPSRIDSGIVKFTDGTNEINPSQKSCIAYGYKWDAETSTCVVANTSKSVDNAIENPTNRIGGIANAVSKGVKNSVVYGAYNSLASGVKSVIINGNENTVKENVFNSSIISGDKNIIEADVNNSTIVSGEGALSIRDNETIVGGFYNNGDNKYVPSVPFTTQRSMFMMQGILEDIGTEIWLEQGTLNHIPLHSNSRVVVQTQQIYLGDTIDNVSSRETNHLYVVDADGVITNIDGNDKNNLRDSGVFDYEPPIAVVIEDDLLRLRATAYVDEKMIAVASVTITEIIYRPN